MSETEAPAAPFKYRAFISYSHRDAVWADWLHKAVERYRVPRTLVGRRTAQGVVTARLTPLFRDREELAASTDLSAVITAALQSASHLVVLCSPRSAASKWVNEEILAFKRLGREDRIVAIIVDGEPNSGDPATECFPEALKFRVGADGALTGERTEPVAADARDSGDGKDNAKLKLIAGLLGVGLDELKRRELQAQRRRTAFAYGLTGLFALLAVAAVFFAVNAEQQRARAEAQEKEAVAQRDRANAAVDAARDTSLDMVRSFAQELRNAPGAQVAVLADILDRAIGLLERLAKSTPLGSKELHVQAVGLTELAAADRRLGDLDRAVAGASRAIAILQDVVAREDADAYARDDLASAYDTLGNALIDQEKADDALAAYRAGLELRSLLSAATPDDRQRKRNLYFSHLKIGDALEVKRDFAGALAEHRQSVAICEELAPGWQKSDRDERRDLPTALSRLANMNAEFRRSDEALQLLERSLALSVLLSVDFPDDTELYRDRGIAWGSIGNVHMQRETWSEARTAYLEALVVRSVLHETDPSNLRWAQDLYFAYANLGVIEGHLGNRSAALDWSRKALALLETMLAKNPDNPRWKADADTLREQIAKLQQEGAEP